MADSPFSGAFFDPAQVGKLVPGQPPAGAGSATLPASFGGPVPPGQTPPPGVNPHVVFTDAAGKGYDPTQLTAAWNGGQGAFAADPMNARVRDILPQYQAPGAGINPAPSPIQTATAPVSNTGGATERAGGVFGTPTGMNDPRASAFFDTLMGNLNKTPDVSASDPTIKAGTDAYAAQQERANRSYLSKAAESGGANGNLDAVSRSLAENAGQQTGGFQATLMNQERQARRSQIQNILSQGSAFLTSEQQLALQKELSDMNLQERAYEFGSNDAYRYSPFAAGAVQ